LSGSSAVQGGRRLQLRVLGFPVHIDLSFPIMMTLIGYGALRTPADLPLWLAVATVSVLIHELGHAVAARLDGGRPEIALSGFGGLTTYRPTSPLTRLRALAFALSGPAVGLLAGGALYVVFHRLGGDLTWVHGFPSPQLRPDAQLVWDSWQYQLLAYGLFTCLGWSVLNLLPVVPLDGGAAMQQLLPGDPEQRARRAAGVSVLTAAVVAGLAYLAGLLFLGLFMLFFGLSNLLTLRNRPDAEAGSPLPGPEQIVVALLWQGSADQARRALEELPPGSDVDLAVHAAVMAATGQPEQGFALLHQELARRPKDPNVAALLVLALALCREWDRLDAELRGPVGEALPWPVLERAAQEATSAGRPDVAARLMTGRTPNPSP